MPADMDGDGILEVVVGNAAYRPDGSALWYNGGSDGVPAIADMDLDGEPEVAVGSNAMRAYRWGGTTIWQQPVYDSSGAAGPILYDCVRVWNRGTGAVEGGVTVSVLAGEGGTVLASETLPGAIPSGSSSAGAVPRVNAADLGGARPYISLDASAGAVQFMAERDTTNNAELQGGCP